MPKDIQLARYVFVSLLSLFLFLWFWFCFPHSFFRLSSI
jgi:hypothetical protein